eukprot:TRINITY_DN14721_c0_g1_i1.p1 TRINITY_DN14721_c0_g1~~TRINITY_DN14721_c0_g1_i1.p1  ORF type:complete len:116 (+),score=42.66 TRINITY_DN14721_c0_g1_i1:419-766(+)
MELEQQLFTLIERVNSSLTDNKEISQLRNDIERFHKELSQCRQSITKNASNEGVNKHLNNVLEDLQENISDIRHEFEKKYTSQTIANRAYEQMLRIQVENATRQHQKAQDDLFGL